jgi:hypothetical protein
MMKMQTTKVSVDGYNQTKLVRNGGLFLRPGLQKTPTTTHKHPQSATSTRFTNTRTFKSSAIVHIHRAWMLFFARERLTTHYFLKGRTSMNASYLPLVDAVEIATGRRPHLSTCIRWTTKGAAGIKLESFVLGGRRLTTSEHVLKFLSAVTAAKTASPIETPISTPRQAEKSAERSAKKLAERLAKTSR